MHLLQGLAVKVPLDTCEPLAEHMTRAPCALVLNVASQDLGFSDSRGGTVSEAAHLVSFGGNGHSAPCEDVQSRTCRPPRWNRTIHVARFLCPCDLPR